MWSHAPLDSKRVRRMLFTACLLTNACIDDHPIEASLDSELGEDGQVAKRQSTFAPQVPIDSVKVQTNGLRSINGLRTINGLHVLNGLRTINGLRAGNGLRLQNGSYNLTGLATRQGRSRQTTSPDGLLSSTEGLLRDEDGKTTAKYVVKCALAGDQSIVVKDYTGTNVALRGGVGLAPEWKTGDCSQSCQEKVSACLMALTNGDATNVEIELAAPNISRIGGDHSFPHYEAAFYGNLFLEHGEGYTCLGEDNHIPRMDEGYETDIPNIDGAEVFGSPYYMTGDCHKSAACTFQADTPMSCRDADGNVWNHVITTYRKLNATNIVDQRDYWDGRCERGDAEACKFEYTGWVLHLE